MKDKVGNFFFTLSAPTSKGLELKTRIELHKGKEMAKMGGVGNLGHEVKPFPDHQKRVYILSIHRHTQMQLDL